MSSADNKNGIEVIHGGDIYRNNVRLDFSVNLDPLPMPAAMERAVYDSISEINQYPDPLQQELRSSIADFEGVSAENVICGNGASELLMAAVHAVMPKRALVAAPCYAGYARALEASDAVITEYILSEASDFELDAGFADMIENGTDMVFIADPNNPNGRLAEPGVMQAISEKCGNTNTVLLIDECFKPLTASGISGQGITEDALHLRAFTKTFAIPGIRIGYMLSENTDLLKQIEKHLPEWNVSRIAERAGEAAAKVLAETDYLERSVNLIAQEREYLKKQLEGSGFKVYPSDANYLLIKGEPDLYDKLLARGILIRRCANFSGLDDRYFRIAVRTHSDNEELIKTIGEVL